METDPKLGWEIHTMLRERGVETPIKGSMGQQNRTEGLIRELLLGLGLDLKDDSLGETPRRVAKMFHQEIFGGLDYDNFPKCTTIENKWHMDEVVLVRNQTLRSTCEHHLQPIYGSVHIAYLPNGRVIGLSKLTRVASFFAARPQVQERLTEQIHAALVHILETDDVAVIIEAEHYCMRMRGVKDACSDTVTSRMTGRFREVQPLREETLLLINRK
jgi:GTP cyclohydrolase I